LEDQFCFEFGNILILSFGFERGNLEV